MAVWYGWFNSGWLVTKLIFVVVLLGFHGMISGRLRRFQSTSSHDPGISRAALTGMVIGLAIIVTLAVTKLF